MIIPGILGGMVQRQLSVFERDNAEQFPELSLTVEMNNKVAGAWLVDRSCTVKDFIFKVGHIPEYDIDRSLLGTKVDFGEAMRETSGTWVDQCDELYVLWSGGIDSTAMIVSLLELGIDKSHVKIACNPSSIREYPDFYHRHIVKNFDLVSVDQVMSAAVHGHSSVPLLAGEPADALHGTDFMYAMFKYGGAKLLELPPTYENQFSFWKDIHGLSPRTADYWTQMLTESFAGCPRNIDTMYHYCWWINFNWRWQHAHEKIRLRLGKNSDLYKVFYDSPWLNAWTFSRTQPEINTLQEIKIEQQKYIYQFTNDADYFKRKVKAPSITWLLGSNTNAACARTVDQHGVITVHQYDQFSVMDYFNHDNHIRNGRIKLP